MSYKNSYYSMNNINNINKQNLKENYKKCPICKNIFLKNHIQEHYIKCFKVNEEKIKNENILNSESFKQSQIYVEQYYKKQEIMKKQEQIKKEEQKILQKLEKEQIKKKQIEYEQKEQERRITLDEEQLEKLQKEKLKIEQFEKEQKIREQQERDRRIQEQRMQEQRMQEQRMQEQRMQEQRMQEQRIQEQRMQEQRMQEQRMQEQRIQEQRMQEQLQEQRIQEKKKREPEKKMRDQDNKIKVKEQRISGKLAPNIDPLYRRSEGSSETRERLHPKNKRKEEEENQQNQQNQQNENTQYNVELETIQKISDKMQKYISRNLTSYDDNLILFFLNKYEELFANYVSNKCIALVGPASSIVGSNKGHVIDKFDLIVRLNKALPLPENLKNDIGSRTDIIYNSLNTIDYPGENNLSPKLYKKHNVQFVCSSYPFHNAIFKQDILNYVYRYKFEIPFKSIDTKKFNNFERYLGTRPYTGTCAIMELLSYPIKYLYITGLDFYQTKYYSEYRVVRKEQLSYSRNSIIHQCEPQLDYLKNISLFDNRIILDNFLDNLLYQDYYNFVKKLNNYDSNYIFNFGDQYFKQYFELKISTVMFSNKNYEHLLQSDDLNSNNSYLMFTSNRMIQSKNNNYYIFITNNKNELNYLNSISNNEKKNLLEIFILKKIIQLLLSI